MRAEAAAPRTERHLGGIWILGEMSIEQTIADSSFARWKTAAIGVTHVGELSMNSIVSTSMLESAAW